MKTKNLILLAIGCFLLAIGIVVIYMWRNGFSIPETGTLGDAFNGLLAPFISFAGALLVYFSFREQIKANKIITSQWLLDMHLRMLDDARQDFEQMELGFNASGIVVKKNGREALKHLCLARAAAIVHREDALNTLSSVLAQLLFLINKLKTEPMDHHDFIWYKLQTFYDRNLAVYLPSLQNNLVKHKEGEVYAYIIGQSVKLQKEVFNLRAVGSKK